MEPYASGEEKNLGIHVFDDDKRHNMHHALLLRDDLEHVHQVAPHAFSLYLGLNLKVHYVQRRLTALHTHRLALQSEAEVGKCQRSVRVVGASSLLAGYEKASRAAMLDELLLLVGIAPPVNSVQC